MVQLYVQIVWDQEHEHHLLKGKANFPHLVDYLNLGNGNEKRNRINLKQPRGVSTFFVTF